MFDNINGNSKNYILFHQLDKKLLEYDWRNYNLSFDDGNFYQYYYYPFFKNHKHDKIIFPIPKYITFNKRRKLFDNTFLIPEEPNVIMSSWVKGEKHFSINLDELKFLIDNGYRIGCHSYNHDIVAVINAHQKRKEKTSKIYRNNWRYKKLAKWNIPIHLSSIRSKLAIPGIDLDTGKSRDTDTLIKYIREDTEKCLEWFDKHLNIKPVDYAFPFNDAISLLKNELELFGFSNFYGNERFELTNIIYRDNIDNTGLTYGKEIPSEEFFKFENWY